MPMPMPVNWSHEGATKAPPNCLYIRDNFKHSFERVIVVLELSFWTLWKADVQTYKWV